MRLLVVGAGATGGYFGGRLARAGRDVTFLVRPRRAAQLRDGGLRIQALDGALTVEPAIVTAGQIDGAYDAVLMTVKGFALRAAMDDAAPAVGPGTAVLPVLNGMRHMDVLAARFGAASVAGCVCKVATTLDADGTVVQLAPFHELSYGERDGAPSPRMERIDAFMQGAGFAAKLTPTVEREMWEKWVLLAAMGAATCLMRGTVGEIAAAPGGPAFANALLDEVVAAVRAVGSAPSEPFLRTARATLTAEGSKQATSMYRDLRGGHDVEADAIVGDLVRRAEGAGIAVPLLSAAYAHLSVYRAARASAA